MFFFPTVYHNSNIQQLQGENQKPPQRHDVRDFEEQEPRELKRRRG